MRLSLAYARRAYTRAVAFRPALSAPPRRLLRSGNTALSPSSPGGESVVAPKKRLSDILNNRGSAAKSGAYTFNVKGSVKEAIAHFTKHHTGVCVAVNDNGSPWYIHCT